MWAPEVAVEKMVGHRAGTASLDLSSQDSLLSRTHIQSWDPISALHFAEDLYQLEKIFHCIYILTTDHVFIMNTNPPYLHCSY